MQKNRSATATTRDPVDFFRRLRWIDGSPLARSIEPYRERIFRQAARRDEFGRLANTLVLSGRAKKNWKTADAMLFAYHALLNDDSMHGNQVYVVANDEGQAADDLELAKKICSANPLLASHVTVKAKIIERNDGRGFIEILPAKDVAGAHGKTFRLVVFDEIHGYRNWDILEALQLDPTRPDAQWWITSYASMYHKPGAPLFDLMKAGREDRDPRMLFSWYAADFTTDPEFKHADPEARANPSRGTWSDPLYLEQQRGRLPAHKYRRLHLNLPGLPEGSAYQPDPVMDAIDRGVTVRPPQPGVEYVAFIDMSGGSSDDAVLAIGHVDAEKRILLDRILNQGQHPPFDPSAAVARFVPVLREYRCSVVGDAYAGQTFRSQFEAANINYRVSDRTRSQIYEAAEPALNARRVALLDAPTLEQQLLGLVWRGGKIDHQPGEHDDWANAAMGVVAQLADGAWDDSRGWVEFTRQQATAPSLAAWVAAAPAAAPATPSRAEQELQARIEKHGHDGVRTLRVCVHTGQGDVDVPTAAPTAPPSIAEPWPTYWGASIALAVRSDAD